MAGHGSRHALVQCTHLKLIGTEKERELQLLHRVASDISLPEKNVLVIDTGIQGKVADVVGKLLLRQVGHDVDAVAVL